MMQQPALFIVNPLVSGIYLQQRFNALGYKVIAFFTVGDALPTYNDALQHDFDLNLHSQGELEQDIAYIQQQTETYDLVSGFVGFEGQYQYAEKILARLFPAQANDAEQASLRCNKHAMQQACLAAGLAAIPQLRINPATINADSKKLLAEFQQAHSAIVLKPEAESNCAANVLLTDNADTAQAYLDDYQTALYGSANIIVEPQLQGQEYYINSASVNGRHIISHIGSANKQKANGVAKSISKQCLALDDPQYQIIETYCQQLLDALGMKTGLAHIEILISDGEIYLLELNPRAAGGNGIINEMARHHTGYDQYDAYCHLLNPASEYQPQSSNQYDGMVCLYNILDTKLDDLLQLCTDLCSYHYKLYRLVQKKADFTSLLDLSAIILLSKPSQTELDEATAILLKFEQHQ